MNKEEMIEKAEQRLETADLLIENLRLDSAVSEIYYGMFHAAKALLKTEGSEPKTHSGTVSELGKLFRDRIDRDLISELSRIRELRETADYEILQEVDIEDVKGYRRTAENFLDEAKRYLEESPN